MFMVPCVQARELVEMGIEAYKNRSHKIKIPSYQSDVVTGFGVESIVDALGGSLDPLLDVVKNGSVRGIAAVVGCTNNRNGHDSKGLPIMKGFLENNVLVIAAGCMSSAAEIEGFTSEEALKYCGEELKSVCVESCPEKALKFVEINGFAEGRAQESVIVLTEEAG